MNLGKYTKQLNLNGYIGVIIKGRVLLIIMGNLPFETAKLATPPGPQVPQVEESCSRGLLSLLKLAGKNGSSHFISS